MNKKGEGVKLMNHKQTNQKWCQNGNDKNNKFKLNILQLNGVIALILI